MNIKPEPELHFQPDPNARYDEGRPDAGGGEAVVGITKLGFIGNEQYYNDF